VTGSLWTAFWLGMRMIVLVLGYRFGFYQRERVLWHDGLIAGSMTQLAVRLGSRTEARRPVHADQEQRAAARQPASAAAAAKSER
jgi:hypothetical protein